jgi:glutaredoxin
MTDLVFFGADWCGDCRRSKAQLNELGINYELKDVEARPEAAAEAEQISGRKNIPVILFKDGKVLVEPSNQLLESELRQRGLIA